MKIKKATRTGGFLFVWTAWAPRSCGSRLVHVLRRHAFHGLDEEEADKDRQYIRERLGEVNTGYVQKLRQSQNKRHVEQPWRIKDRNRPILEEPMVWKVMVII